MSRTLPDTLPMAGWTLDQVDVGPIARPADVGAGDLPWYLVDRTADRAEWVDPEREIWKVLALALLRALPRPDAVPPWARFTGYRAPAVAPPQAEGDPTPGAWGLALWARGAEAEAAETDIHAWPWRAPSECEP